MTETEILQSRDSFIAASLETASAKLTRAIAENQVDYTTIARRVGRNAKWVQRMVYNPGLLTLRTYAELMWAVKLKEE